ncbi:MAG: serine hydrolase domain-containing protein, partial [Bacteroidota bacterium]
FTTVSIMQLYERGELSLDDPVFYYIPAFFKSVILDEFDESDSSFTTRPTKKKITIRHLLTHTSGITYPSFNPGKIQAVYAKSGANDFGLSHATMTTEEMANQLAKVPLVFEPGERYMYGLNMEILGRVIEVASGMSLSQYFKKNIFEPLGLTDTHFYLPQSLRSRLVPVYTYSQERKLIMAEDTEFGRILEYPKMKDNNHYAGGGGMSGTAMDYAIFIQALLNDGEYNGNRILSRKTIDIMTSDQMIVLNEKGNGFSNIPGITFGLGFSLLTEAARGVSHKSPGTYEWGGYFNTKYFIDPEEEMIFVGMTQIVPFARNDFWDRLNAIIYGAIED